MDNRSEAKEQPPAKGLAINPREKPFMKTLITAIAISLTLFATSAAAEELMTKEEAHEFCSSQASLANSIMDARQKGVSMVKMITRLKKVQDSDVGWSLTSDIITIAYLKPKFSTERVQRETAIEFENQVFMLCIQNVRTAD